MTEQQATMIQFVNKEKDAGAMVNTIQRVYDLTMEMESVKDAINVTISDGFENYKEKVDDTAKKGDYSKFVKKLVTEMQEGKVSEEVKQLENILDYVEIVAKEIK